MRKLFPLAGLLALMLTLTFAGTALAQKTTVYVVRHAEKDVSDPSDRNPPLSKTGQQRAADLFRVLEKENVDAIFSTDYLRTRSTAGPVAENRNITIAAYPPSDFAGLAEKIKKEYAGKTVLVVGHSNTVLQIVQALGGQPGISELTEEDYDYLFRVTIGDGGKTETAVTQFGEKNRRG
ncbi:MAG TPA: phosphoglycerate mutase family protein [Sphingobacteriaceae bacterium]